MNIRLEEILGKKYMETSLAEEIKALNAKKVSLSNELMAVNTSLFAKEQELAKITHERQVKEAKEAEEAKLAGKPETHWLQTHLIKDMPEEFKNMFINHRRITSGMLDNLTKDTINQELRPEGLLSGEIILTKYITVDFGLNESVSVSANGSSVPKEFDDYWNAPESESESEPEPEAPKATPNPVKRRILTKKPKAKPEAPISIPKKEFVAEHKELVEVLKKDEPKEVAKEAKKQEAELKTTLKKPIENHTIKEIAEMIRSHLAKKGKRVALSHLNKTQLLAAYKSLVG